MTVLNMQPYEDVYLLVLHVQFGFSFINVGHDGEC